MRLTATQRVVLKLIKNPFVKAHIGLKKNQFSPEESLVLTGDPRSGTTWLSEVLAAERGVTIISEPLGLRRKHITELSFSWRMFIDPKQAHEAAKRYFDLLLTGQIINAVDRHRASLRDIWATQTWLVKFVRANRLLPWLVEQYMFSYRPLHIIRHPCGVIYSQLKHHTFQAVSEVSDFDYAWIRQHRPDLLSFIETLHSEVQIRALTWALDNYIPLKYWSSDKWIVCSYEEAVTNSEAVLNNVYQTWGKPIPDSVLARIPQKSRSTYEWAQFDANGRKQLGGWQEGLGQRQIDEILEVVNAVGLTAFTKNIEPDYTLLYRRHE